MDRGEILKKVNAVFIDVLHDENVVLTDETTANDIEDWDSLNHIRIVVAIEKQFQCRFTSKEIQSWANIGQMIDSVSSKF